MSHRQNYFDIFILIIVLILIGLVVFQVLPLLYAIFFAFILGLIRFAFIYWSNVLDYDYRSKKSLYVFLGIIGCFLLLYFINFTIQNFKQNEIFNVTLTSYRVFDSSECDQAYVQTYDSQGIMNRYYFNNSLIFREFRALESKNIKPTLLFLHPSYEQIQKYFEEQRKTGITNCGALGDVVVNVTSEEYHFLCTSIPNSEGIVCDMIDKRGFADAGSQITSGIPTPNIPVV